MCINCRRGADTAQTVCIHTRIRRPTYEAPTREYTHKHTRTQTNTQRGPTKYGADSRRGGALLIRGGRLAPTPSKLHLCRDQPSPTPKLYVHRRHRHRRCACSASHVDVDQLTSFSYCRFVSLFRTLCCIRRKSRSATTGSLQPGHRHLASRGGGGGGTLRTPPLEG